MIFYFHANKTYFHKKGFALSLVYRVRVFVSRKWSVTVYTSTSPLLSYNSGNPVTNNRKITAMRNLSFPKSTSTLGPDSAVEGRRQNRGEIAKNIGERSEHCSARFPRRDIFAVWPWFLPSSLAPPPPLPGRKNVMSMRELFCPDPLAGFEKMAGFQIFYCLKIKCFHS